MYKEILEDLSKSYFSYRREDIYESDLATIKQIEEMLINYLEYVRDTKHQICVDILDMDF